MRGNQYFQIVHQVLMGADTTERTWLGKNQRRHGIPYQFIGQPILGPQCATVTFQVRDQDLDKVVKLGERFAYVGRSQFVRVYRDRSVVRVEFTLPYSEWRTVRLSDLPHERTMATIGQGSLGGVAKLGWDPPHKAVFGSTRTGKSVCLVDIILSLSHHSPDDYRFLVVNPKNDPAFDPLTRLPHLAAPIATNTVEGARLLRFALAEMTERVEDRQRQRVRWVVFIDETAQLVIGQPEAGEAILQLGQFAGGLNMNMILANQAPHPTVFGERGSLAKVNLGGRIVFNLPNSEAYLATGLKKQHTGQLGPKGDGLAIRNGIVSRFRAALPEMKDYETLTLTESPPTWPTEDQIVEDVGGTDKWRVPPTMLAYALVNRGKGGKPASAYALQKYFGGAMDNARMVRDYADELLRAVKGLQNERV